MGHRRFARHWSVPQIRGELTDTYQIPLSADAIEDAIQLPIRSINSSYSEFQAAGKD